MPTYTFQINETEDTVVRPLTASIISRVLAESSLDTDNIPVYLMGDYGVIPQAKSTLDEGVDKHRLASNTRCEVTVTEEYLGENTTPELYSEHLKVFEDPYLDMYIKPVYVQCKNTVTVQLTTRSRVEAMKWQKSIRSRVNRNAFASLNSARYYYPIPSEIIYILGTVYKLRENVAGYKDTMGSWLRNNFTQRLDVISNQKGEGLQFIINETQGRIIGHYDFDYDVPKPEKQDDGSYTIEFNYAYTYDQPQSMIVNFPVVIHNQLAPDSIVDQSIYGDDEPTGYYLTASASAFHQLAFNSQTTIPNSGRYAGTPVPRYDDWMPMHTKGRYDSLLRIACAVSLTEPTWIATINEDVYPHSFPAHIVTYMRSRPHGMLKIYDSLFNITVHRWRNLMDSNEMVIGKDLRLLVTHPLDLRDMYHVCIDTLTDISALTDEALADLGKHPDVYDDYIDTYYPGSDLENPPRYPVDPNDPDGDYTYNPDDIRDTIEDMDDEEFLFKTRKAKMMLVNLSGITAHRTEDLRKI